MTERVLTPELAKQLFGPRRLDEEPPEPPVAGLPPKDKNIGDYTDEEREAQHASFDRTMREKAKRERQEAERAQGERDRTDAQHLGDALSAAVQPGAKRARDEALVRSLLPSGDEDG